MIAAKSRRTARPMLFGATSRRASTSAHASRSATTPSPPKPQKIGFNHPRTIFYGWAALVVVAGFAYYSVKTDNTAKKREFMIKQGRSQQQQQQQQLESGELGEDHGSPMPALMSNGKQEKYAQSPLQSLTAAFSRQTTQRSRTERSTSKNQ